MRPTTAPGRTELLASVPLFRGCTAKELTEIDALVDDIDVSAGEVMTRDGEPARESYIVVAGEAVVTVDGREIARLGPGSLFGEMAGLDPSQSRGATVTAVSPMRLLVLQPSGFHSLVTLPGVSQRILAAPVGRAGADRSERR